MVFTNKRSGKRAVLLAFALVACGGLVWLVSGLCGVANLVHAERRLYIFRMAVDGQLAGVSPRDLDLDEFKRKAFHRYAQRTGNEQLLDAWGRPVKVEMVVVDDTLAVTLTSAGANGAWGDSDDRATTFRYSFDPPATTPAGAASQP